MIRNGRKPGLRSSLAGLLLMISVFSFKLHAQHQDLQGWSSVEAEWEAGSDLDLSLEIQHRMKGNLRVYDRSMMTGKFGYDLPAGFKITGGLRYQIVKEGDTYASRYRINGDLHYDYPLGPVELGIRSRLQYGIEDQLMDAVYYDNKLVNRNRLELKHHIFGTRFTPYGSAEIFQHLNRQGGALFYKMRYAAGIEVLISTTAEMEVFYMLEDEFNVNNPLLAYIVGIGLEFKIP